MRGMGIDDYVAVSYELVERTSEIEYWKSENSDHVALACSIKLKHEQDVAEKEKRTRVNFKIADQTLSWKFWKSMKDI